MKPYKYNPNFNSGSFRNKIVIFSEVDGEDKDGFPITNARREICIVWCAIKTVRGTEYVSAAATQNENIYRFIIRYRPGIDARMKIDFKGRIFDIQSVLNDDELHNTLTIVAKERV